MNRRRTIWLISFLLVNFCICSALHAKKKINLLLLSGKNNHEWQKTTPELQEIFNQNNLFSVSVTERPDTLNEQSLKPFQLIVSNWNAYPEMSRQWPAETEQAIINFVKKGRGFIFIHSASSTHYDWPEFQYLAGASWGDSTRHGKVAPFLVKLSNTNHPVTKGFADFLITDELWVNMRITGEPTILANAFAPASNNGSNNMEPIIFTRKYGKGRSFFIVLGHDVQAMKNLGYRTLLLRGAEWAAKGKVTIPVPRELKAKNNTNR